VFARSIILVSLCIYAYVYVCVHATATQRMRIGLGEMSRSPCPGAAFTQSYCQGALAWISVAFQQNTNTPWGQTAKQKTYLHQRDTGMWPNLHPQNPPATSGKDGNVVKSSAPWSWVDIGIVCLAAQLGSVCSQVFVNNSAILEFQHLLRPDLCVVSTADKLEWFLSLSLSLCVCVRLVMW